MMSEKCFSWLRSMGRVIPVESIAKRFGFKLEVDSNMHRYGYKLPVLFTDNGLITPKLFGDFYLWMDTEGYVYIVSFGDYEIVKKLQDVPDLVVSVLNGENESDW